MLKPEKFYDKSRLLKRLHARTRVEDGHWLWIGKITTHGRGVMQVGGVNGKDIEVHRVSAFIHHGLDLNDSNSHALHKPPCNVKNCWNPDHLHVGTHADNMQDITKMPNFRCGHSRVGNSKKVNGGYTCRICVNSRGRRMRKMRKT